MVKTWQAESGEWPTGGGDPVRSQRDRVAQKVLKTKAEPQAQAAEAKPGCRRTEAESVHPRTEVKPEEEVKGLKVRVIEGP